MYEYNATVIAIHDGDTLTAAVDLGFKIHFQIKVRFYGINAPELATPEGKVAAAFLQAQLPLGSTIDLKTIRDAADKYGGRYDGIVTFNGVNLNDLMISSGHAVPFMVGQ